MTAAKRRGRTGTGVTATSAAASGTNIVAPQAHQYPPSAGQGGKLQKKARQLLYSPASSG